jgi:hypothetical protein
MGHYFLFECLTRLRCAFLTPTSYECVPDKVEGLVDRSYKALGNYHISLKVVFPVISHSNPDRAEN